MRLLQAEKCNNQVWVGYTDGVAFWERNYCWLRCSFQLFEPIYVSGEVAQSGQVCDKNQL